MNVSPLRTLVLLAALLASSAASAAPSLRVRGSSLIEASAIGLEGQVEVKGALRDDTGRPIGNARVQLRLFEQPGGAALALPAAEACAPSPSLHEARSFPGQPDQYVVETDDSGAFCVRIPAELEGTFELLFQETAGLYDGARKLIPLDRSRLGVELALSSPTGSLPLEAAQSPLTLELRMRPMPELRPELPIQISIAGRDFAMNTVARAGEATPFSLPRSALARPGPVELVAKYSGGEHYQPAETRLRTSATARVELSVVRQPEPAKPSDGIPIRVRVSSVAGAVPSGSVEARLGDETVGIARVQDGVADLSARFEVRRSSRVPLTLVYLPAEPWWLPAGPIELTVDALPPSSWNRAAWLVALAFVAAWLIAGWWRPRRAARPVERRAEVPRPVHAAVQVLELASPESGFTGVVIDAHERTPIAGAQVRVVRRGFDGEAELERVVANDAGAFELEPVADRGGVWLVAEARWHSTLERPLPPAGRLSIEMITRRRQLVGRLVAWAERSGRPWADIGEPTPGYVAGIASREQKHDIRRWAREVEAAAFGPMPVDEARERQVVATEPSGNDLASERNERDH